MKGASQKEHGIACSAAANSRSAEEHLDAQFALVPSTWAAKGGKHGKITAKKPDLKKARYSKTSLVKRAKMEAVCAFAAGRPVTQFVAESLKLDALVAIYNNLACIQSDPMLVKQGIGSRNPGGRPSKSS
jgi:hypothetical protein